MEKLPTLLLIAWLLPLASFTVICIGYSIPQMLGIRVRYSTQKYAGYIAIAAIVGGFRAQHDGDVRTFGCRHTRFPHAHEHLAEQLGRARLQNAPREVAAEAEHATRHEHHRYRMPAKISVSGDWYSLGVFGKLKLTIGYYIDTAHGRRCSAW